MAHRLTTCTFCGVGCGLYLETADNRIIGTYPSISHPTNQGRICVRGWHVHEVAGSHDRITTPLIKRNGTFSEASWDEALRVVADRLTDIRSKHGPDALAFIASPRCSNEEAYLLQKFARAVIGTNNVDHGSGVYRNFSLQALLEMLGVPASTNSVAALGRSEVIVVDGVDLARRLPTVAGAVIRAKQAGARLIVTGTRRHRVAESADIFLQVRPGSEALLYGAIAKLIIDRGLGNQDFIRRRCRDYDAFAAAAIEYDLLQIARECDVPSEQIEAAADLCGNSRSTSFLYSTGIEGKSKDSIYAVIDLALLTGMIGNPDGGLYALTEHNNLQGVCDLGVLPDLLPGYEPIDSLEGRNKLEALWNAPIPTKPGASGHSVLTGTSGLSIKAAWLCRCDPVSTAYVGTPRQVLQDMEFVVAQHIFLTESAKCADVVLPTTAFGEEDVSFTSAERRIQVAAKAVEPPGTQTPAWRQIVEVAARMGANWQYDTAADVMNEIGEAVSFYSGAAYENLRKEYGRQWPCTKENPLGTENLFARDGREHRFRFVPVPRPPRLIQSSDFPVTLLFGHSLYYWNQNVLIAHSETLRREHRILLTDYPHGFVEINDTDAKDMGIRDGQQIRIQAEGGEATSVARVTPEVRRGTAFVPFFVRDVERSLLRGPEPESRFVPVRIARVNA